MTKFYLQDARGLIGGNMLWWAPNGGGYTTDLSKAAVFSRVEALRQNASRATDTPWPTDYVAARALQVVDMQHLGFEEPSGQGRAYYLQDVRAYGGNDAYWLTGAGGLSTQIQEAAVFSYKAALEKQRACETLVLRRKSIVDRYIGLSVQAAQLNFREAHRNSGFLDTPGSQ